MSERHDAHFAYGDETVSPLEEARLDAVAHVPGENECGSNDHLASIYDGRDEQFAAVVPFIREGLERGERCIYVADDATEDEVLKALRDGGVDVAGARASGALSIHTKAETYVRTGEFDRDATVEFWQDSLANAQDVEGYEGLRAAAEMTWALDEDVSPERLVRYEAILNTIYPAEDFVGLCQYDRTRFQDDVLSDVIRTHPLVVVDGMVCRNDYYEAPAVFFEDDRPAVDVDRTIEGLLARERTTRTLEQRERRLTALTDVAAEFVGWTPAEISERTVEIVRDTLGATIGAVWLYDGAVDDLQLRAVDESGGGDGTTFGDRYDAIAWETLAESEPMVSADVDVGSPSARSDGPYLFVPLARHGVVMVGRSGTGGFTDADVDFVETLATTAAGALDRAEREETLRARERDRERKTETLERLEEINAIIRDVDRAIVEAETRQGIARAVCTQLTDDDRFQFAWIGELDGPGAELVPTECAGEEETYVKDVSLDAEDGSREPSVRAARSGDVSVVSSVIDELESGEWASRALASGYHSVAGIPLSYDGVQYGVLSVYADRSGAFDGQLASVLGELGDTIAYAINATQRKQALLTDAVTEMEFEIRDPSCPILSIARAAECSITLRDVFARPSGGVFALVAVPKSALDSVLTAGDDSPVVDDARPVTETGDAWLVQLSASTSLIAEDLADHGARLCGLVADQGAVQVCVQVPATRPQAVVEMITNAYPNAELLARRQQCQNAPRPDDATRFWERLTDRQREVAQLAFYGGYFERPREQTGEELAARLGVSAQAFHKHIRHIQQELFATTLSDGAGDAG